MAAVDVLPAEETVTEMKRLGRVALPLVCNIEDPQAIRAMVGRVRQEFGKVDVLVNNAAILGASEKSFEDYAPEEWEQVFRVNVRGPALLTQAIWPHMVNQGGGKIVCIGSIAGRMGGLRAGPHYTASKGAIHAFVKWAARKGAPFGIYVNGIAPGPIDTPMIANQGYTAEGIPLGRLGQPEDIAMAVVFLASQASNFITGQILDVNGGILMV